MPADRRATFSAVKPVKTERTHEENQERAYIAASRRSDRSLEARIESARRASEIHKKRTGRALRVTEQDVVNEEMYEEEDDDLPTQYQRLNAHLQTSSWLFNRKLHDYIATQQGVRNMFLHQQFPGHQMSSSSPTTQFMPNGQVPMMNSTMMPPQTFSPTTPQAFASPSQPYSPLGFQQQPHSYRHSPYSIPQRPQPHQRSASIANPQPMANPSPVPQTDSNATTPRGELNRRLSLPPHALEGAHQQDAEAPPRPSLLRTTSTSDQPSASPQVTLAGTPSTSTSGPSTPQLKTQSTPYQFNAFDPNSQVIDINPLSMALPPETQQFLGGMLDPNDPRTALFMAGSDNLPQPYMGTYTYNPNLSPKASRPTTGISQAPPSGITQTLAPEQTIKLDPSLNPTPPSITSLSAVSDDLYTQHGFFTPTGFDYNGYFDPNAAHSESNALAADSASYSDLFGENSFVNWDE